MPHVNFTQQIDIPEVLFILFVLFFLGLMYHLRMEDKREGYPLESDRTDRTGGRVQVVGFPPMPKPKVFLRKFGEPVLSPGPRRERDLTGILVPLHDFPGSPYVPTGDPLVDGVGPASYALKEEVPDMTWHGEPNIVPLRKLPEHAVEGTETSPIGMDVVTRDGVRVGTVADVWINVVGAVRALPRSAGHAAVRRRPRDPAARLRRHAAARQDGGGGDADGDAVRPGAAPRRAGHHQLPRGRPHQRLLRGRLPLQQADGEGGQGMSEFSDIPREIGPADLPPGETVLWRGKPDWRHLALDAFGAPWVVFYFVGIGVWHLASTLHDGGSRAQALADFSVVLLPMALALSLVSLLAWLSARATAFTVTDRRLVMCYGVALPALINLPLDTIEAMRVRRGFAGRGDLAFTLPRKGRLSFHQLWPYARPWHLFPASPMMRAVPEDRGGQGDRGRSPQGRRRARRAPPRPDRSGARGPARARRAAGRLRRRGAARRRGGLSR